MLIDARSLAAGATVDADLCIVGAGPVGITMALEFADTDLRVVILESGDEKPSKEAKALTRGENADGRYYLLERTHLRGFGGTSNHWMETSGMRARPFDPLDFEPRPEIDRPGWPFGREELDPYYARAQEICKLGPYDYAVESWADAAAAALPFDSGTLDTVMFQLGPLGVFPGRLRDLMRLEHVRVLLNATVQELATDESGTRVETARVAVDKDRQLTVAARQFVLGAGGIDNPRLLLLSNSVHRNGLGNEHDLVGRFFMEHPHVRTGVIRPAGDLMRRLDLYTWRVRNGYSHLAMLKPSDGLLREEGLLSTAWALTPSNELLVSDVGRALVDLRELRDFRRVQSHTAARMRTVAGKPLKAAKAIAAARRRSAGAEDQPLVQLSVMSEQAPDPSSRITLGRRRDTFGQRVARLDWRFADRDRRSIRRAQAILDRALQRAGLGRVTDCFGDERPPAQVGGGYHHIGTTRMHPDSKHGVVDPDGRVHGVANLFVTGTSVFPSSGYANPTLTVVALAVRLAAHLRASPGSTGGHRA